MTKAGRHRAESLLEVGRVSDPLFLEDPDDPFAKLLAGIQAKIFVDVVDDLESFESDR